MTATDKLGIVELTSANRDCLAKAKPGEPMFIILGRDPDGGNIVRLWAQRRFNAGDTEHATPVFDIADAMDAWRAAGHLPESAPPAECYPPLSGPEAAALIEELVGALEDALPCINKWSTPAANRAHICGQAVLAKARSPQ